MAHQHADERVYSRTRLYLAVFIVNLLFVSTGCVLTWPSPVLPKLRLPEAQGSWVSSAAALGGSLGPLLNSLLSPLGRRTALVADGLVFLVSWSVLASSSTFGAMLAGRFLGGLAVGLNFICVPLYITEVADDQVRQAVTSLTELFIGIGYLLVYGLGPFSTYFELQIWCLLSAVVFLVPSLCLPESPYHLVTRGKAEEASLALAWFRGTSDASLVQKELSEIQEHCCCQDGEKISKFDVFKNRGYRRALFLALAVLFVQQLSGINVVTSFTEPLLATAQLPISPSLGAVLYGVVNLFSSALAPPLVRSLGSKRVLVISNLVMAVSLFSYAGYTYCEVAGYNIKPVSLLPVIALVVYNIFFCIGGGPLPWSLVAELSPPLHRGFISLLVATFTWLVSFCLLLGWAPASRLAGLAPLFTTFASLLTLGTLFIQLALPDTRGLSLHQVQRMLAGGKEVDETKEEQSETHSSR